MRLCCFILLTGLLAAACQNETQTQSAADTAPPLAHTPPAPPAALERFSGDSAFRWVEKQLAFGPRVPGTAGHRACGDWMVQFLKAQGGRVVEQTATLRDWKGQNLPLRNIIASFGPEGGRRIILSAHWDTRPVADEDTARTDQPIPGANDGASGVAVLLELARVWKDLPPHVGVDLFFWDAEDGGVSGRDDSWCLGSQYWAKNRHDPQYQARFGINLDMVGGRNATFTHEVHSRQAAQGLLDEVWRKAHALGYGQYFLFQPIGSVIDDHYFVYKLTGIPYIDIIHVDVQRGGGFFPHWHTHADDLAAIDRQVLEAVGRTLLAFLSDQKPA
jgi:hypothetical protein